jgi:uncharacterized protein (TIGR02598 family)
MLVKRKSSGLNSGRLNSVEMKASFTRQGGGVQNRQAFTLVEVVLAIGVVALAGISLLGLITVAMQSSQNAAVQAAQATVISTVTGKLSSQNFTTTAASLPITTYFSAEGTETNASAAIYRCDVMDVSPANSATNFMRQVQLVIRWPAPIYAQTNVVEASFVKYD